MDTMKECDLIMKGGITSGVVYPKVITELASAYKFVSIGGTSAGAIAAGFTAAAEYNRSKNNTFSGFETLNQIPDEISQDLLALLEPLDEHKKTFSFLAKVQNKNGFSKFWSSIWNLRRVLKSVKRLPATYYGVCTGLSRDPNKNLALTDWMNFWLEKTAGNLGENNQLPAKPLTFGMLEQQNIKLRTITTNLSQRTPINLPSLGYSLAKIEDLKKLLPSNVVDYIASMQPTEGISKKIKDHQQYYVLPTQADLPVLLAIRLSLSFPVLLAAFPIYRIDHSLHLCPEELNTPKVCWLSDGGITSNFPIHLFDNVFPSRPTFGISLGEYHACRHEEDEAKFPSNRIYLPQGANQGLTVNINEVGGIFSFLMSIFNSAQTWQDSSQMQLAGYRERVVRIALKEDEGGMNLNMPADLIKALTSLGQAAGAHMRDEFDLDEHRWRRVLSAYAAIESAFEGIEKGYKTASAEPMEKFLQRYADGLKDDNFIASSYKPKDAAQLEILKSRLDEMVELASKWGELSIRDDWGTSKMPQPSSALRIVPERFLD
jgi:predicted acylesterase/phospholipase RssA